jgi:drug/metabolite transporter (DMT)-like permease
LSDNPQMKAYLFLAVTTLCWGLNANFGRLAVGEVSPMQVVMFRWIGVVLLLLVFAHRQIIRDWPLLRRHLPFLALMGAFGFTAFNALFYVSAHYTSAINIGILQGSMPMFVLLGTFVVFRQSISRLQILGVGVTLLGVIIVASGGNLHRLDGFSVNRGDLLMLIACVFYSAYSLGLSRGPRVSAMALFAVMACAALIVSLPLVAVETWLQGWSAPTPKGWLIVALITLLPSFLAQILFIHGVKMIGPGRAGPFLNLVPVFAAILAVVILQEVFELYHALSLALVLGGIWISERGKPARRP